MNNFEDQSDTSTVLSSGAVKYRFAIVLERDPLTETARFIRLAEPRRDGSRTWMSPDRR